MCAAWFFAGTASAQDSSSQQGQQSQTQAQQQNPPDPAKPPAPQPNTKKPSDRQEPVPPPGGETTGKSKLEKETGTINDRIFEVVPNYGTVENAGQLPALSTGQKYRIATASVFDYFAYPFYMALAGIAQAYNSP